MLGLEQRHAKPEPRASSVRPVVVIEQIPPRRPVRRWREEPEILLGDVGQQERVQLLEGKMKKVAEVLGDEFLISMLGLEKRNGRT